MVSSWRRISNSTDTLNLFRRVATDVSGDWTREFRNNSMFKTEDLKRWYVITTTKARRVTDDLIDSLIRAGRGMSMTFIKPRV